jgi:hypothetical protein
MNDLLFFFSAFILSHPVPVVFSLSLPLSLCLSISVTIEEGSTSTSTTFSSSNRRRVDDGWEEDIEDETPVGLLFHTDAGSKVAEIK